MSDICIFADISMFVFVFFIYELVRKCKCPRRRKGGPEAETD